MHGVANCRRQCIGSMIGFGSLLKSQDLLDHVLHLLFFSRPLTHYRHFYLAWRIFPHIKPTFRAGNQCRPTSLPRCKCSRNILSKPYCLNTHRNRIESCDNRSDLLGYLQKPVCKRHRRIGRCATIRNARKARTRPQQNAPARIRQPRVDSQYVSLLLHPAKTPRSPTCPRRHAVLPSFIFRIKHLFAFYHTKTTFIKKIFSSRENQILLQKASHRCHEQRSLYRRSLQRPH